MKMMPIAAAALALSACATAPGMQRSTLDVSMTGLQAVPGPGDPDGSGTAEIRVDPAGGRLCWNLWVRGIDPATAAHIHRGAPGIAGPPVVPLTTPDAAGRSEGCADAASDLVRDIGLSPHLFYVNVHNAAYPAGAVRGQLRARQIRPVRQRDR